MYVQFKSSVQGWDRGGGTGGGGSDNCIKFHLVCFFALCSMSKVSIFSSSLVNYLRLHNIPARRISQGWLWKFLKIF